jgi:hypothetical protein
VEEEDRAKRVVFAVLCRRVGDLTGTLMEEYATIKSRLPPGTGLILGRSEDGIDAVVVLRGTLATVGDLNRWFDVEEEKDMAMVEPQEGQNLEEFLKDVQAYCGRLGATCGERIAVGRGDVETLRMLENLEGWKRYAPDSEAVNKLGRAILVDDDEGVPELCYDSSSDSGYGEASDSADWVDERDAAWWLNQYENDDTFEEYLEDITRQSILLLRV